MACDVAGGSGGVDDVAGIGELASEVEEDGACFVESGWVFEGVGDVAAAADAFEQARANLRSCSMLCRIALPFGSRRKERCKNSWARM